MRYGDFSMMFLGAASEALQKQLLEFGGESLKSNLLVAPSGFETNMLEELMAAIAPEAIITASKGKPATARYQPERDVFGHIPRIDVGAIGGIRITSAGYPSLPSPPLDDETLAVGKLLWRVITDPLYQEPGGVSSYLDATQPRKFYPEDAGKPPFDPNTAKWLTRVGEHRYQAFITAVKDLDTIVARGKEGEIDLRLLGINAPEMNISALPSKYQSIPFLRRVLPVLGGDWTDEYEAIVGLPSLEGTPDPFAETGKKYMERQVKGRRVELEFDEELLDIYDRPLVYVFSEQGEFLNLSALELGLAVPMPLGPSKKYREEFKRAAEFARKVKMGLWKNYDAAFPPTRPKLERRQPLKRKQSAIDAEVKEVSQIIGFMPSIDLGMTQQFSDQRVEYPV
jgi:micrococcal nuclease